MRDTLNAPVRSDGSGYWYGEPNFFIKSIPLSEGEAFAITVMNPLLEQYRNTPLEKQLRSVFSKIASCLPDRISVDTSFLNPKITFIPDKCEAAAPGMFQVVFDALRECRPLCFGYRPLSKSSYKENNYMNKEKIPFSNECEKAKTKDFKMLFAEWNEILRQKNIFEGFQSHKTDKIDKEKTTYKFSSCILTLIGSFDNKNEYTVLLSYEPQDKKSRSCIILKKNDTGPLTVNLSFDDGYDCKANLKEEFSSMEDFCNKNGVSDFSKVLEEFICELRKLKQEYDKKLATEELECQ